ncbi:MAG: class I SAM-dependent methyltransferase [Pseudomonadota bacterium]
MDLRRHTDVIAENLPLDGAIIVDVGCGSGGLARWLARQCRLVVGVDPQPGPLSVARRNSDGHVRVVAATAEALPLATGSVDVAIVFNSLHHFANPATGLEEAARVVKPKGNLLVAEPLAAGAYFELMQPIDDETAIRARALEAVDATELSLVKRIDYAYEVVVADLEAAIDGWLAVDPTRRTTIDAARDELADRFARVGQSHERGWRFRQPMRMFVLTPSRA